MRPQDGGKTNSRAGKTSRSRLASLAVPTNVHPLSNRIRDTEAGNRFRSSFDQVAVGVVHTTTDGRILEVNHKLCEMLGYTPNELLGMTTRDLTYPDDRDQQNQLRKDLLSGTRSHFSGDKRYLHKDGSVIWVSRTVALARESSGSEAYLIQTIDNISERKNAEAGFLRLSRARQVAAECTHILVHATNETEMLNNMVRVVVESGGYIQAWVGMPTGDPARPVQLAAHAGYGEDAPMTANETINSSGHYQGAAAKALASGEAHIARDILNDPQHKRVRPRALQLGYQCSSALPLRGDGQLVGVMVLHAAERDAFDDEEIRLLDELSDDIGFGITTLRTRAAQMRAEQRSREHENRFREIFEQAAVGIIRVDMAGLLVDCNQKFSDMLGYAREELLGKNVKGINHPDDYELGAQFRAQLADSVKKSQSSGKPQSSEKRFLNKNGAIVWTRRTVSAIYDAAGKPLYVIGVIEDITEQKHAEEIITRERALLRTIIDALPDHIYAKDRSGSFLLANKAWLAARGEQEQDIAGKTVHDYFSPEVAERLLAQDLEIIATGNPLPNFEQRMIIKKRGGAPGPLLWASTSKMPLRTATGEIIGTVGISRDITEQKRLAARRAMEHTVTRLLAELSTPVEAMPKIIQTMCETMGWAYGARWVLDKKEQRLNRAEYWCESEPEFDPVDQEMWLSTSNTGSGRLIRRAWIDKTGAWLTDLQDDKPFRRRNSVIKLGWHSAYAFPIQIGNDVIGIMEFFGPNKCQPDEAVIQVTEAIGSQIGQFIQRKQAEDKLNFLARFDTITDLPNRYLFTDRLGQMLVQAQRSEWSIGILFVDLDRFKLVNDTHGHAAGDQLLRQVATRMQACVRSGDTVGRLSGDEFAVALSNLAKADDAGMVAQKIVEALAAPFDLDGQQAYVSASIGISLYPGDGGEPDVLLQNADTAMYRAKEKGRNGYQFFLPQMNERLNRRQQLESQLRGALERKEFLLQYQPKASLATGAITGFEALLRWQRGNVLVPPMDFITILEDTGLIVPVGEWVLKTVCEQIRQWTHDGITPQPVAVNLSARQFQRNDLAGMVGQALSESGIDPALLKLELTESLLMNDAKESIEALHRLEQLGVHLSVDDFGTGYSSLAYLKRFPLNELKIDRAFIRDVGTDPDDAAITLAIINLAHSLKLRVVAEGVETVEQLNFLRLHNCDEIQGYYFARPLPIDECSRMLAEDKHLV